MASPSSHRRTILFVDVVASTELYEDLGDTDARARMAPCLDELQGIVAGDGGVVVKSLGDGILAAYDGEGAAVDSALRMLSCAPRYELQVSVGVHTGEVLEEAGDVFGQAVNVASRLSALAQPSEVLVTQQVVDRLSPQLRQSARRLQHVAIKGLREPLELYALGRGGPAATMSISSDLARSIARPTLAVELRMGERTWLVGPGESLHLGRDPGNDVVVEADRVSRRHAVVAHRRGKLLLVDQSVNGTWLIPSGGAHLHLLREEATLQGTGEIVLGMPPDDPGAVPISYRGRAGA